jgi:parallel beta-helix repeat protein
MRSFPLAASLVLVLTVARGTTFYCDPQRGSPQGDGSAAKPWRTLEEVLAARLVALTDSRGKTAAPGAPVQPGDTILLRSGWHGAVRIPAGYNAQTITLAAETGHAPQVGWIEIGEGCNWTVRGLTVSPSLAPAQPERAIRNIVTLGERGGDASSNLVVESCFVYSTLDTAAWSARDWLAKPASGIWLGRHGRGHVARNNYVLNTRFGVNLCAPECVAEGNVIDSFSGDGLRATCDAQVVRLNVIKNIYVSAKDGDENHDDGIQVFLFGKGRGTVRAVTISENLIIACTRDELPFRAPMQGIGCFDGPLVGFTVANNVVLNNTWHGLTLCDAQGCTVSNNVVFSRWPNREQPWLMLGAKQKVARGNTVCDNRARAFNLKDDPEVKAEGNKPVTELEFIKRQAELLERINARFGTLHATAQRPRL